MAETEPSLRQIEGKATEEIINLLADLINTQKRQQVERRSPEQIEIRVDISRGDRLVFRSKLREERLPFSAEQMYFAIGRMDVLSADCFGAEFTYTPSENGVLTISQRPEKVGSHMLIRLPQ